MQQYVVPMYESERGWGSKIDGYAGPFDTLEQARAFARGYNNKHNNLPTTPDWYISALEPVPYKNQVCDYRSTLEDPDQVKPSIWNPMSTAPKDFSFVDPKTKPAVLIKFRHDIYPTLKPERKDLESWNGVVAVMYYAGEYIEWCFAAPVGTGGFSDEYFEGWLPVPGDGQ